jgi:hypothetical protein
MAAETCEVPSTGAQSRYAAEWGLAALILSGILVLAAILALLAILLYVAMLNQLRPSRTDVLLTAILACVLSGLFTAMTLLSIVFGLIGVRAAWRRCQPGGLPVAGLILSLFSVLLWAAVIVGLVMNMIDLSRRQIL